MVSSTPSKSRRPSVSKEEQHKLIDRLALQQAEIERLSTLHEDLQHKIEECDDLKKKLQEKDVVSTVISKAS